MDTQRISFIELRQMAMKNKIKNWGIVNKDELCKALGVVRAEHEPKFVLTNTETGEVTKWRSAHQMIKILGTNPGSINNAVKNNKPFKIRGVKYTITQIR